MLRRFYLYFIGVGFGIIISIFFFGNRDIDFSYFPNARVLKHLRGQEISISDKALCQLNCLGLTENSFERIFKNADLYIDFGSSNFDGNSKTYHIEVEHEKLFKFYIHDCDNISTIISFDESPCECF